MIAFHNDHLVSPEFCKLMYQTVPEWLHVPIVFNAHTDEYKTRGIAYGGKCPHIELNLQGIYYESATGFNHEFGFWKYLLHVAYHEFGHFATWQTDYKVRELNGAYEIGRDNWNTPEYKAYRYIEDAADNWSNLAILQLAEHDKRLCQPDNPGAYFNGREAKLRKFRAECNRDARIDVHEIVRLHLRRSGGQYTITDVACHCGEYSSTTFRRNTALIRRLAADLAYPYTDHAGRVLYFFAYGDLPEIQRRVAAYRAIHPKREPEFKESEWEVWKPVTRTNSRSS
jgi:hypothetical protein